MSHPLDHLVAGLRCREVLDLLDAYLDSELPHDTRAAVEAHVSSCSRCASFGDAYARVVAVIKQQGHGQDLDPAVALRLNDRLRLLER
jgi:anti-sigma factor (TIGR02949 family)